MNELFVLSSDCLDCTHIVNFTALHFQFTISNMFYYYVVNRSSMYIFLNPVKQTHLHLSFDFILQKNYELKW